MKVKVIVGTVLVIALAVYFRFEWRQLHQDNSSSTQLSSDDREKIVVDPVKHTITVINAKGTTTQYLPDRPSTIDLKKGGDVVITARQSGIEHNFFAGGGFASDGLRFAIGTDIWYFKKLDLGVFVSDLTKDLTKPRIGVNLSYTVWHDTRVSLGVDMAGAPNVFITERF